MALYLVTGGCGFIGSHLSRLLLAAGHQVRILDDLSSGHRGLAPPSVDLQVGSITHPGAVSEALEGADGCFHLAAIASVARSVDDWIGTHETNLSGTIRIFQRAAGLGIPVVYASSAAVYGEPRRLPLDEEAPLRPLTPYGADKLGCELHARVGGAVRGLSSFGLRFFNVFGPNQDPSSPYSGVISRFTDQIAKGQPIKIFGDGEQSRDFVYVEDVVRHLAAALPLASAEGPVTNVCTGKAITINQLAEEIMTVVGRRVPVERLGARPGEIRCSVGSPDLAARTYGFRAATSLAAGLVAMLGRGQPARAR
jgi:UDP-glucose 4-epimerase